MSVTSEFLTHSVVLINNFFGVLNVVYNFIHELDLSWIVENNTIQ